MLIDEIKKRTMQAMKAKDELARDVLRVALGEIQTAEARATRSLSEEEATAIVRKLVKSNEETLALASTGERADALRRENEILRELLPSVLSVAQIVDALASQAEAIRAAKSDGQATGLAMKHLKGTGAVFEGSDVTLAVKQMRGG